MASETQPILIAEEIGQVLDGDGHERSRLDRVVEYLRHAIAVDVCTLYRYSNRTGDLYIECTEGLAKSRIGNVALHRGEGLTSLVIESKKPLPVRDGPSHPHFRYVPGLNEEAFHSYLGVPILNGGYAIGALVVQTVKPRDFSLEVIALLTNVARQISAVASQVFDEIESRAIPPPEETAPSGEGHKHHGRPLAPGFFLGEPYIMDHGMSLEKAITPQSRGVEQEIKAIRKANRIVMAELEKDAKAISGSEGYAVLMAHKVILEDEEMAKEVLDRIRAGDSAAEAVRLTGLRWVGMLENAPDPMFAARAADFRDIGNRLLHALGIEYIPPHHDKHDKSKVVALGRMILPGDLLRMGVERLGALIMSDQGMYSHSAILARSLGIPAIQVDSARLDELVRSEKLLVDGTEGTVLLNPEPHVAQEYLQRIERIVALPEGGPTDLSVPVATRDGFEMRIGLNAGLLHDFDRIEECGPDDVGLYRTEIAFMSRSNLPGLRAQVQHYRKVIELARGRRVVFRTFDFGGDKVPASLHFDAELNPEMGCRSTRYLLGHLEVLRVQLRALLSASAEGPMSILFPMISTPEELNLVLDEINSIKNELDQQGSPFDRAVPIGIMLEVPSVMFILDELSREVDFFCVGSNDLVQYLMAADRSNSRVAWLCQWHHPAVLVALDRLLRHCQRNDRPVTLCGEMASNPWAAMLLVGMGYNHLSTDCHSIPLIKWTLLQSRVQTLRMLAHRVMRATSSTEVIEICFKTLDDIRADAPPLAQMLSYALDRIRAGAGR